MHFCHIAPSSFLNEFVKGRPVHLVLSHLIEKDPVYTEFYLRESETSTIIMDNGGFECYKAGIPMYPSEKLIEMGKRVGAHYIVMSDYPGEPGLKTIDAAIELAPKFRDAGFGTFFVPQSRIGDINDFLQTFLWACDSDNVDYIGLSILGIPNAYGVEKNNKLQRYLSRKAFLQLVTGKYDGHTLSDDHMIAQAVRRGKKFHCLGMVDGPNEIIELRSFLKYIQTWDSSAAIWAGLNGIQFDQSPTGLINGKFEKEVDFNLNPLTVPFERRQMARNNMNYIDGLCEEMK